jgi:hypothetical protein
LEDLVGQLAELATNCKNLQLSWKSSQKLEELARKLEELASDWKTL